MAIDPDTLAFEVLVNLQQLLQQMVLVLLLLKSGRYH